MTDPAVTHDEYENLHDALKLVCDYACNNFILDCTNGITLRDEHGQALCGGYDNTARYLLSVAIDVLEGIA